MISKSSLIPLKVWVKCKVSRSAAPRARQGGEFRVKGWERVGERADYALLTPFGLVLELGCTGILGRVAEHFGMTAQAKLFLPKIY